MGEIIWSAWAHFSKSVGERESWADRNGFGTVGRDEAADRRYVDKRDASIEATHPSMPIQKVRLPTMTPRRVKVSLNLTNDWLDDPALFEGDEEMNKSFLELQKLAEQAASLAAI